MKRHAITVSLTDVKFRLGRCEAGYIENKGGWGVFIDARGRSHFIVDDEEANKPVRYDALRSLANWQKQSYLPKNSLLSS